MKSATETYEAYQHPARFPAPQLRTLRKDVAELLRAGKVDNARIRVEAVLREESLLRAYDGGFWIPLSITTKA